MYARNINAMHVGVRVMDISVSSIIISLIIASILVGILQLLIARTKAYGVFRIDFIATFAVIVLLRLLVPAEYFGTYTISSHHILPAVYGFLAHPRFSLGHFQVTWFIIIGVVWLVGFLAMLSRLLWQGYHLNRALGTLPRVAKHELELTEHVAIPANVTIYRLPGVASPFVSGLRRPKLIIPAVDLAPQTLTYIMHHELQHIKNHDVFLKYLVSLLVCVYWWFPIMYIFRRQANMIIEMRVDNQVVQNVDKDTYLGYTQSLVTVTKQLQAAPKVAVAPALSAALLPQFTMFEKPTLTHRIKFLLTGRTVKRTNRIILALIIFVPLMATSIIFEPDSINPEDAKGTFEINPQKDKILAHDGKYYLWHAGKLQGLVDNPHAESLGGMPIVKHIPAVHFKK